MGRDRKMKKLFPAVVFLIVLGFILGTSTISSARPVGGRGGFGGGGFMRGGSMHSFGMGRPVRNFGTGNHSFGMGRSNTVFTGLGNTNNFSRISNTHMSNIHNSGVVSSRPDDNNLRSLSDTRNFGVERNEFNERHEFDERHEFREGREFEEFEHHRLFEDEFVFASFGFSPFFFTPVVFSPIVVSPFVFDPFFFTPFFALNFGFVI